MTRTCPACHKTQSSNVGVKNGYTFYECSCGSLYTGVLPADDSTQDYDAYYSEANLTVPAFIQDRLKEIIATFQPFLQAGTLLDVGFGAGDLLRAARDAGWTVSGIEVSQTAVEHGRALGLDVRHGDLMDANYPDNYFDVVTASEILEHCDEPESLVDEVYRILRPGGLFWATTPSAGGLSYRLIGTKWSILSPPEHLQIFSRRATYGFLSKFSDVTIKTHGFNLSEASAHFKGRSEAVDRVNTGYALNESLTRSPVRKAVKTMLNGSLNILGLGDSLKIRAIK
jgi:SAM-dependent methyltransferase